MTPTNAQIIAEAERRRLEECKANGGRPSPHSSKEIHVINIMREGWTPPEPVADPDLLAFREWFHKRLAKWNSASKEATLKGRLDKSEQANAFVAGARMAREQEQERAKVLVDCVRNDAARLLELAAINDFDETVADGGITSGMVCRQEIEQIARSLSVTLAKYRGEA